MTKSAEDSLSVENKDQAASMLTDCAVIGTGPAGLAAALALAGENVDTRALGPDVTGAAAQDPRTTAVFSGSVAFLRHLGVWKALESSAEPLVGLRLIDDTGGILRAPEVLFRAREIGLPAFGYNIENAVLLTGLRARALRAPNLHLAHGEVTRLVAHETHIDCEFAHSAPVCARVVAGADGRRSPTRTGAGIGIREWPYRQSAIATRFRHARSHDGISTEFHRRSGPLTTVPLPGDASSLVWVEEASETARLVSLPPEGFARELEDRLQGLLGTIYEVGLRAHFPLMGLSAERMTGHRTALVGEAAHVLPPIGAQGLNLGLRDAATLAEVLGDAVAAGLDPGGAQTLGEYGRRRRADVASRTIAVDLLNRSLIADLIPWHLLRGAGLHMLDAVPWLRQLVMHEGVQPSVDVPRLMRSQAP
jgi:2-octaprenyl-6-methoxyphenol hydroxylase